MPIYNSMLFENVPGGGHRQSPAQLAGQGATLQVSISIPQALVQFYSSQHIAIPSPITGIGLIDTGASISCVHAPIMSNLGVNRIGVISISTPAGPTIRDLFPAHFTFPTTQFEVDFASVIGADLTGQIINGQQLIALIGRDVLALSILIYNGPFGSFSLSI